MKISHTAQNVFLLAALALMAGSAFSFIKIALGSIPPLTLTAARIVIAALLLMTYVRLTGNRLPTSSKVWRLCFAIGLTGVAAPFCLVAWAEQFISSSTTAITMALVPLTTLIFAHFMTEDEKISRAKLIGILIGFGGVFLLFSSGKNILGNTPLNMALGMGALLLAVMGFALSSLLSIQLRGVPRPSSSAAIMIASTFMILPLSLAFDHPWALTPSWPAIGATVMLGLFPTALGLVILIVLVDRAGATFFSLVSYLVPVVGLLLGAVWLDEKITWQTGFALLLICIGIYITGRKIAPKVAIS